MDADDFELAKTTTSAAQNIYESTWRIYTAWTSLYLGASVVWIVGWVFAWWHVWLVWPLIPTLPLIWVARHYLVQARKRWESADAFLFPDDEEDE